MYFRNLPGEGRANIGRLGAHGNAYRRYVAKRR